MTTLRTKIIAMGLTVALLPLITTLTVTMIQKHRLKDQWPADSCSQ